MRNDFAILVGNNMRDARTRAGLSQAALARLIRAPASSISRWEGAVCLPEPASMKAVAYALGVTIGDLLSDGESKPTLDEALGVIRDEMGIEIQKIRRKRGRRGQFE